MIDELINKMDEDVLQMLLLHGGVDMDANR